MSKTTNKYSPEVRERSVRMVLDHEGQHESRWAAMLSISSKIGCAPQTLNEWVKKAEVDGGRRAGMPTEIAERLKALERENRELRQRSCASLFCDGGARAPVEDMIAFIDDHRGVHGVAPICKVLPIAPSTDHDHLSKRADRCRLSARARRDAEPRGKIARVFEDNFRVYGVRKV